VSAAAEKLTDPKTVTGMLKFFTKIGPSLGILGATLSVFSSLMPDPVSLKLD
jgi:hypothetical protein